MKKLLLIIIIPLQFSCTEIVSNKNDQKNSLLIKFDLVEDNSGKKIFELDSMSIPLNSCVQLIVDGDSLYYTFYNELNNAIYFYDFNTSKLKHKIQLEKEGPDGVYPYQSGYYIYSLDSIYFYSMKTNGYLYLLDRNGKKNNTIHYTGNDYDNLRKLDILNLRNIVIPPSVHVTTENPVIVDDGKIYLIGEMVEELFGSSDSINNPIIYTIDTQQNKVEMNVGYPQSYRRGNWGEAYYRTPFWCFNSVKDLFVISFPNDHYVYLYTKDFGSMKKVYAGSRYVDEITSVDYASGIPTPKDRRLEHYFKNYYYRTIIYDKYRDIYYRIIEHPWKDYNKGDDFRAWAKPISVIIYDSNFNFMGEKLMDMDYHLSYMNFFINKDGLYLYKKTDNEDLLEYTLFRLSEND